MHPTQNYSKHQRQRMQTQQVKKPIEGEGENMSNDRGGYMRSLHSVEQKLYGPDSPLDGRSKVLLFIRHNTIRWDQECEEMSYLTIAKATGLTEKSVKDAVKFLENKKMIKVMRRKIGKKDLPNIVGLNEEYFGYIIEPTCRPKLSVVQGGKTEKLSTGVPNDIPQGVPNDIPQGGETLYPLGHQEPHPEPVSGELKNSFKEQYKKLLRKDFDYFTQGKKTFFREPSREDLEKERERQIQAARKAGIL